MAVGGGGSGHALQPRLEEGQRGPVAEQEPTQPLGVVVRAVKVIIVWPVVPGRGSEARGTVAPRWPARTLHHAQLLEAVPLVEAEGHRVGDDDVEVDLCPGAQG